MRHHQTKQDIIKELEFIEASKTNPAKFSFLYDKYHEQIFLYVFKRVDNEAITADITSQVFYKALKNIRNFKFQGVPFSAWLYRIASNETNMFFRKTKKQRSITLEDHHAEIFVHGNSEMDTEDKLIILGQALNQLKVYEVELIELRYFEQKPFREIAFILGITETNAKVRTHRILQKLKKILASAE